MDRKRAVAVLAGIAHHKRELLELLTKWHPGRDGSITVAMRITSDEIDALEMAARSLAGGEE